MIWLRSPKPTQSKSCSWFAKGGLALSMILPLVQVQASAFSAERFAPETGPWEFLQGAGPSQTRQAQSEGVPAIPLELDDPIEGELAVDRPHPYLISLDANQYVKVLVLQRSIDVIVRVFGPDGKPLIELNYESRFGAPETASWVAEAAGTYRLEVVARYRSAPGRYEIRLAEQREATESERALHEAQQSFVGGTRLFRAGKYDEARSLLERALEIQERVMGPEDPTLAAYLTTLAATYVAKGEYAKAEPIYQRVLAIREKALSPDRPEVAQTLNDMAIIYSERGDYVRTETLYQRARTIMERELEPGHPLIGFTLLNLGNIYKERGDFAKAESFYHRTLENWEKSLGPEHPNLGMVLQNLGSTYQDQDDSVRAEQFYRRALAIKEKALGPEHPSLAITLNDLAFVCSLRGDEAAAEPLYRRALAIMEKSVGPENFNVANAVGNLAALHKHRGEYAEAESLYRRALAIREKAVGAEHPLVAISFKELATLYAAKGDIAQAMTFLSRANAVSERNLALNLAAGSERQKLAYLARYSKETDLTLSLHTQAAPNDPQALELAFTTLLRRKGRGLDAVADTVAVLRLHAMPEDQALFDQLADARSQLAALTLKEPGGAKPETYRARLQPLEERVEKLEVELSSRSAEFRAQAQPVTLAAVQGLLPSGSALVEYVVHTPLDLRTEKSEPARYLAYLLTPQGPPKWVDLGEAAAIDQAVEAWRLALRDPDRTDVKLLARTVDKMVMQPVRTIINDSHGSLRANPRGASRNGSHNSPPNRSRGQTSDETRRLLIAPDGSLNLIPFAAMVNGQDRYLVERYTISYLASGRDLLRLRTSPPSKSAPLVVANPAFGKVATVATENVAVEMNRETSRSSSNPGGNPGRTKVDPTQVFFQPLPGTEDEALAIKTVLPGALVLLREDATEAALKRTKAPSILHIATHGFFLNDQEAATAEPQSTSAETALRSSDLRLSTWVAHIENPLLRSGLALAGANQSQSQNGTDDGVLTALEMAGLDLWGTKLVVLSACDTGIGEVKNGEGVQGLRRALVLAGSESQVISLWPVPDELTKDLMVPYYQALRQGVGRSEGLRQVQLRLLRSKDRRHPFHWAAFIQSGEWAALEDGTQ